MKIKIPESVQFIIDTLNKNNHEAFVVGGCVRDSILGIQPMDWDITTSAEPLEIKDLFNKTVDTGLEHGTVTVVHAGENYEVTTYRIDGEYEDHRRPTEVFFTKNLIEDLKRRDFTINAMAYHNLEGLVDPFHGQEDLKKHLIRCVGKAEERFEEDALRMLRAVRFSAKLGFDIHEDTIEAIKEKAGLIAKVSVERIREELNKLLVSAHPKRFTWLQDLGLMTYIMPDFIPCFDTPQNHPYHVYDVATHIMKTVEEVEPELALRWTMLLHDIGKSLTRVTDEQGIDHFHGHDAVSIELTKKIMKHLKFDNKTLKKVVCLVQYHDYRFKDDALEIRMAMHRVGKENFAELLKVQKADAKGQNFSMVEERLSMLDRIQEMYEGILAREEAVEIKELAVSGKDVMAFGYKGKLVGEVLEELLHYVIQYPEKNKKEDLVLYLERKK